MIPKGLFTQIAMMILSVSIIITYVEPSFSEIGKVQDDIDVYLKERSKVESVNERLAVLVSSLNNVSNDDNRRLLTYMPDIVDEIAIPRDLSIISRQAGVLYKSANYVGVIEDAAPVDIPGSIVLPKAHSFSLSVEGTYGQLKNLFRLMEQNNYQLEVRELSISQLDGGFLSAEMKLVAYSYQEAITNKQIVF